MRFMIGQRIRLSVEIRRSDTQALVDPGNLTLAIRNLSSREVTSFSFPADPEVVRDALGQFHADVTPEGRGMHAYRWSAQGDVEDAAEGRFWVQRSRVLEQ